MLFEENELFLYALTAFLSYLLGSIATGRIVTKLAHTEDLSKIGSGNIGATNVLRTGRKDLALFTLIGDCAKGFIVVFIAQRYYGADISMVITASIGVFLGHIFPLYWGFKGGKGVATYIGIILALNWSLALIFCAIWLLLALLSRYSSLAALGASLITSCISFMIAPFIFALLISMLTGFLWIMHRHNIKRLLQGAESKIHLKSNK